MRSTTRNRGWRALAALTACLTLSASVAAEEGDTQVSVEARARAAEAYDHGTAAYLDAHFALAAHWFERAYRTVPTSAALLQAVRAHRKAGHERRAANLSLEMRDTYPDDPRARDAAAAVIDRAQPEHVLVEVRCASPCTLEVDDAVVRHPAFFVTADVEHTVKAAFDGGEATASVVGPPGETRRLDLAPPLPPPPPPVPRWAFFSSLGATVALGAVTIWSGVDANRGVADYQAAARTASSPGINTTGSPTPAERAQALLDEGRRKERRTNILIGVTAATAVTTAVLGVFTDWKGESRSATTARVRPSLGVARDGGAVGVYGRF